MLSFNEMRQGEGTFSDITFKLDGVEALWKAHKLVLYTSSPFFRSMFSGDWLEATQEEPILIHHEYRNLTAEAVDATLLYIYTGTLPQYNHKSESEEATDLTELLLDILALSLVQLQINSILCQSINFSSYFCLQVVLGARYPAESRRS